ncbi:hypothetical protein N9B82_03755 [Saprospiraceae bacterium]|nr:hypothetical protein [Saprospiraceae bacterium]
MFLAGRIQYFSTLIFLLFFTLKAASQKNELCQCPIDETTYKSKVLLYECQRDTSLKLHYVDFNEVGSSYLARKGMKHFIIDTISLKNPISELLHTDDLQIPFDSFELIEFDSVNNFSKSLDFIGDTLIDKIEIKLDTIDLRENIHMS